LVTAKTAKRPAVPPLLLKASPNMPPGRSPTATSHAVTIRNNIASA